MPSLPPNLLRCHPGVAPVTPASTAFLEQPVLPTPSPPLPPSLLRCHPGVAPALAPYLRHLLPCLAVFRGHRRPMLLPAPHCLPPAGTFAGGCLPCGVLGRLH